VNIVHQRFCDYFTGVFLLAIGVLLLVAVTLGIGIFWGLLYIFVTMARFYKGRN
jgi:hypothetical protein